MEFVIATLVLSTTIVSTLLAYQIGLNRGKIDGVNVGTWRGWRAGYVRENLPPDITDLSELPPLDRVSSTPKIPAPETHGKEIPTSDEGTPVEGNDPPNQGF